MLSSRDITKPGFYWYYPAHGAPPVLLEVSGEETEAMTARFHGSDEELPLHSLTGSFHGPMPRPLA